MEYIKLNRKIMDWEWYGNINTCRLFIHMLLRANWKDGRFEGKVIPRGSFVSSLPKLADETSMTIREVRTAISHLKSTGEVTCKTYPKYTVFTVKNYCEYQSSDIQNDSQTTGKRHSNDILTTTIEEKKEGKKGRNTPPISPLEKFGEFATAYPKRCTGCLVETEYCNAVLAGVPEDDLVLAAQNYANICRREKTAERYIKKPENFLRENLFMQYLKGENDGSVGRDTGTHEKSLNELMQECGDTGDFQGF